MKKSINGWFVLSLVLFIFVFGSFVMYSQSTLTGYSIASITNPDHRIIYYPFNDGTATDASGNNIDGSLNGPVFTTEGYESGSLDFDGSNDYISINTGTDLDNLNTLTVSAFVNFDTLKDSGIIGKYTNWGFYHYALWYQNNNLYFQVGSVADGTWETKVSIPTGISTGNWYHIAGTYDGSNVKLYINGVELASTPETRSLSGSGLYGLCIGNIRYNCKSIAANEVDGFFDGQIDQVMIYNRALTGSEIEELSTILNETTNETNTTVTCTDSEGGKDYYTKGISTNSSGAYTDFCLNNNYLNEYFCVFSSNMLISESFYCPYGCSDGACLEETTNETNTTNFCGDGICHAETNTLITSNPQNFSLDNKTYTVELAAVGTIGSEAAATVRVTGPGLPDTGETVTMRALTTKILSNEFLIVVWDIFKSKKIGTSDSINIQIGTETFRTCADCPIPEYVCFDTDGPNNYINGLVKSINESSRDIITFFDNCEGSSVREYTCNVDGISIDSQLMSCQYGCENQICLTTPPNSSTCYGEVCEIDEICSTEFEMCIKAKSSDNVTVEDLVFLAIKLEEIKIGFDNLETKALSIADYYSNQGDTNISALWIQVANISATAEAETDNLEEVVKSNAENMSQEVYDQILNGIKNIKLYLNQLLAIILEAI